jgi:hypothetical protein
MSNFSIYPSAIDGYQQLPLVIDGVSPVRAEDLNRYRSAIVNVETTLGVEPQVSDSFGEYDTVAERLEGLDERISNIVVDPDLADRLGAVETGLLNANTAISNTESNLEALDIPPPPTPSFDDVVAVGGSTNEKITVGGISVGTISLVGVDGVVNWDMATGMMAKVSLAADSAFGAPSNISPGATYILIIEQSVTVNTVWHSIFNFPNGVPTSTIASGTTTIISFISYDGVKLYSVAQDNF